MSDQFDLSKMRIYRHFGKGRYIGSAVIVITDTEENARNLIRTSLDNMGLQKEPVADNLHVTQIIPHRYVHEDSGDY